MIARETARQARAKREGKRAGRGAKSGAFDLRAPVRRVEGRAREEKGKGEGAG